MVMNASRRGRIRRRHSTPGPHAIAPEKRRKWSGRRDSNPRHPPWKGGALPTELLPLGSRARPTSMGPEPVAVRTDDIALGYLGQDTGVARTPDHASHADGLRRRVTVIEVHRAGREAIRAIGAGHVAECVEKSGLSAPSRSPTVDVPRPGGGGTSTSEPIAMCDPRPKTMAVRADNVALGDLVVEAVARPQHRATFRQTEGLGGRVPMVEIHLLRCKTAAAVRARAPAPVTQVGERFGLPPSNAADLAFAMGRVVRDP